MVARAKKTISGREFIRRVLAEPSNETLLSATNAVEAIEEEQKRLRLNIESLQKSKRTALRLSK